MQEATAQVAALLREDKMVQHITSSRMSAACAIGSAHENAEGVVAVIDRTRPAAMPIARSGSCLRYPVLK